ncbi:Uncharacterised protein [Citrobacter amalonaticus]|nr:Uncharacterised protein [Citrobacter amalonaticus]
MLLILFYMFLNASFASQIAILAFVILLTFLQKLVIASQRSGNK